MNDEQLIAWYDEEVAAGKADGRKVADTIEAVIERALADPGSAGIDREHIEKLVRGYIQSIVRGERGSRARKRTVIFQRVHDALAGLTIMGDDDPILDQALRTGTSDGLDKCLRFWEVEDWLETLGASAEHITAAVEADKQLRDLVNPIIATYAKRGGTRLGDML